MRSAAFRGLSAACALGFALASAGARERGDPVPVASVDVDAEHPAFDHRPADAPRALQFFPKGGGASSCGLLPASAKATRITPLLEPEDGAWPECDGIHEAASFAWRGRTGYVFRVLQRDTREDVYPNDQFVFATRSEIEFIDELNGETEPEKKPVRWIAAWAKARLMAQEGALAGFVDSAKDAVVTDTAVLLAGRSATSAHCRLSIDTVGVESGFAPVALPCRSVLATAAVPDKARVVFLALVDTAGQGAQGRVFVADPKGVRESVDLERALQPAFATGRMLDVKAALRHALSSR